MTPVAVEDPPPPVEDRLQAPFFAAESADILDFGQLHQRYPVLARFRESLGHTPLWEVPSRPGAARILAKCEWHNPVGSIKDRTAYSLLCDALRRHGDKPLGELRILEYSGGNLANALSYLGEAAGVRMRFVLASFSPESLLKLLQARGAAVDLVPKEQGFVRTIRVAQHIAATEPEWVLLFQHANPVNVAFHQFTTGHEILHQLGGRVPRAWVASIGSGGTLVGVLRALREHFPELRAVGVTPAEAPYGNPARPSGARTYDGSGGHGYGLRQPFVKAHDHIISSHRYVDYPTALATMGEFFDLTGVRIGSSSAANWLVARDVAAKVGAEFGPDSDIVTVFPCAGTPEQWMELCR